MRLILASNSPRRRELLLGLGYEFTVKPSLFEESAKGLSAYETVRCFANGKAEEVFSRFPEDVVLAADTVVALEGEILGKPKNEADAERMLLNLSGKEHSVFTGVCVICPNGKRECVVETKVYFHRLAPETVKEYVKSGLPLDKAGAYGIQDGYPLVEKIEGSYTNVVGLPVEQTKELLAGLIGFNAV